MPIHLLESNLFWFDDGGHWVCLRSCLIAFVKRCFSRMKISSMLQNCPYIHLATEHFSRRFFYITSCIVSQAKSSMLRRHFIMPRLKYHNFEDFWITRCCYYAELHIYELNRQKCAALHICRDIFAREKRVKRVEKMNVDVRNDVEKHGFWTWYSLLIPNPLYVSVFALSKVSMLENIGKSCSKNTLN